MSLNTDLGHLYHDYNIWNEYTALDAKEKLRTREINARETKFLAKYSSAIDRAKTVCKQQNEREQKQLRLQLQTINARTPSLQNRRDFDIRHTDQRQQRRAATATTVSRTALTTASRQKSKYSKSRVSAWSVGSLNTKTQSSRTSSTQDKSDEFTFSDRTRPLVGNIHAARCGAFVKKADHVTKSLERLYIKSKERKLHENNVTVLDVLDRESKHELETALFLLRGSDIGSAIEEILNNREKVSKHVKGHLDVDNMRNENDLPAIEDVANNPLVPVANMFDLPQLDRPAESTSRTLSLSDESTFKSTGCGCSDDDIMMSSTVVNPSETEVTDSSLTSMRWTELLRTPALWKLNKQIQTIPRSRPMSLVTLAGKQRHTMLK